MEELFIPPISKSRKPKTGSNQLSKMNYGKATASEKAPSKNSPFGWAFGFWDQKPKSKVQLNRASSTTASTNLIRPIHTGNSGVSSLLYSDLV